LIVLPRWIQ